MTKECKSCGETGLPLTASFCLSCGVSLEDVPVGADQETITLAGVQSRKLIAFAGSLALFVGVFTPIITMPVVGSINYFQNGRGDGVIVLLLAAFSFVLALGQKYRFLLFTGGGSLAILAFTFFSFQYKMSQMQSQMKAGGSDNPFAGIGEAMLSSVQFSWGWAVLVVGSGCLIAAALLKDSRLEGGIRQSVVGSVSKMTDKAVWITLGLIFVGWVGFIAYSYLPGTSSATGTDKSKSSGESAERKGNSDTEDPQTSQTRAEDALNSAGNAIKNLDEPANQEPANVPAEASTKYRSAMVISENANFRSTPDTYGEILNIVPFGEEVEIIKQRGPWFQVRYSGEIGWLHGNTIRLL